MAKILNCAVVIFTILCFACVLSANEDNLASKHDDSLKTVDVDVTEISSDSTVYGRINRPSTSSKKEKEDIKSNVEKHKERNPLFPDGESSYFNMKKLFRYISSFLNSVNQFTDDSPDKSTNDSKIDIQSEVTKNLVDESENNEEDGEYSVNRDTLNKGEEYSKVKNSVNAVSDNKSKNKLQHPLYKDSLDKSKSRTKTKISDFENTNALNKSLNGGKIQYLSNNDSFGNIKSLKNAKIKTKKSINNDSMDILENIIKIETENLQISDTQDSNEIESPTKREILNSRTNDNPERMSHSLNSGPSKLTTENPINKQKNLSRDILDEEIEDETDDDDDDETDNEDGEWDGEMDENETDYDYVHENNKDNEGSMNQNNVKEDDTNTNNRDNDNLKAQKIFAAHEKDKGNSTALPKFLIQAMKDQPNDPIFISSKNKSTKNAARLGVANAQNINEEKTFREFQLTSSEFIDDYINKPRRKNLDTKKELSSNKSHIQKENDAKVTAIPVRTPLSKKDYLSVTTTPSINEDMKTQNEPFNQTRNTGNNLIPIFSTKAKVIKPKQGLQDMTSDQNRESALALADNLASSVPKDRKEKEPTLMKLTPFKQIPHYENSQYTVPQEKDVFIKLPVVDFQYKEPFVKLYPNSVPTMNVYEPDKTDSNLMFPSKTFPLENEGYSNKPYTNYNFQDAQTAYIINENSQQFEQKQPTILRQNIFPYLQNQDTQNMPDKITYLNSHVSEIPMISPNVEKLVPYAEMSSKDLISGQSYPSFNIIDKPDYLPPVYENSINSKDKIMSPTQPDEINPSDMRTLNLQSPPINLLNQDNFVEPQKIYSESDTVNFLPVTKMNNKNLPNKNKETYEIFPQQKETINSYFPLSQNNLNKSGHLPQYSSDFTKKDYPPLIISQNNATQSTIMQNTQMKTFIDDTEKSIIFNKPGRKDQIRSNSNKIGKSIDSSNLDYEVGENEEEFASRSDADENDIENDYKNENNYENEDYTTEDEHADEEEDEDGDYDDEDENEYDDYEYDDYEDEDYDETEYEDDDYEDENNDETEYEDYDYVIKSNRDYDRKKNFNSNKNPQSRVNVDEKADFSSTTPPVIIKSPNTVESQSESTSSNQEGKFGTMLEYIYKFSNNPLFKGINENKTETS